MPYFDVARTEYHRHLGRVQVGDVDFAMRAVTVEYVAGARFDDLLEIFVRVERIGTTSITYDHAAYRVDEDGDTLMATAKATVVCIALDVRQAVPVPDAFRRQIEALEGPL
jgi:acyl-CoA thioester hydrolase